MRDDASAIPPSLLADAVASDATELVTVCRSTVIPRHAYRFYRAILLKFASIGTAPDSTEIQRLADEFGVPITGTLELLTAHDLVQFDLTTGAIRAAYPFSGAPTIHKVRFLASGGVSGTDASAVDTYAMCAIDALGIPLMLNRATEISSQDALTGESMRAEVTPSADGWRMRWEPEGLVVFAPPEEHLHEKGDEAAHTCCPIMNFFASRTNAQLWVRGHAPTEGQIFDQEAALRYAASRFEGVLDRLSTTA